MAETHQAGSSGDETNGTSRTSDENSRTVGSGDKTMSDNTAHGLVSNFYKNKNKVNAQQGEIITDYILQQMQDPYVTSDPLAKTACLYTFKALFEKSPKPRAMEICFERGLLSVLMDILDKEFVPADKSNELLLYHLAMEILWLFSCVDRKLPRTTSDLLLLVTVVSKFTDAGSRFFQFCPRFSQALDTLCRGVCFQQPTVRTVPVSEQIWSDIVFYQPWMSAYGSVPCLYKCALSVDGEEEEDKESISMLLIAKGLAWPEVTEHPAKELSIIERITNSSNTSQQAPVVQHSPEDDVGKDMCEDIVFLNVIGGHYFWAYLGRSASETVDHISQVLCTELPNLKKLQPQVGVTVTVLEDENDRVPAAIRGRVIEVTENKVTVLALDYGVVKTVKVECVYEPSEQVESIPAQAKVCCLAGVRPPPASEPTVELALTFLTNLAKRYRDADFPFLKVGGLKNLSTLMEVGPPGIRLQSVRLLANMSSLHRLNKKVEWSPCVKSLLELLVKLNGERDMSLVPRSTVMATLYALNNIMVSRPKHRKVFLQQGGLVVILYTLRLHRNSTHITRMAIRILRATFCGPLLSTRQRL